MTAAAGIYALFKNANSFLIFSLVGATGAGIYFLSLAGLLEVLSIDYRMAVTIAYLLGTIFNFLTNKFLTFKNRELSNTPIQLFRYAATAAFSYVLTMLIVLIAVEKLHQSPYFGAIASHVVTLIVNYLLSRHWVFAQVEGRK